MTVTRAADGARLYLYPLADDAWLIANVVAAGLGADLHLGGLAGRVVAGCIVLRWAAGALPSSAVLTLPLPASPISD